MDQLKLLWELQNYDEELNQLINKLKKLETAEDIENFELKLNQLEYDICNFKTKVDVDNEKIRRYSKKADEFNFRLKDIEEKLYGGDITDLNQIEHMNKEIKNLKNLIEELEFEILDLMEDVESIKNHLIELENDHKTYKQKLDLAKDDRNKNIKELNDLIKEKKELRNEFMKQIDEVLIQKYKAIKAKKVKALVKVSDDKCTGCHMNIPLTIVSKLKKNDDIYYCDNCDRILLYVKKQ